MRAGDVAAQLATQVEAVAAMLLPHGKRQGREWCAGSVDGEAGDSLKVHLGGTKAGVWCDFASGDSGDLIDLWSATRGVSLGEAIKQSKDYLGIREHRVDNPPRTYAKPAAPSSTALSMDHAAWLTGVRKISLATCARFGVVTEKGAIMFPSLRDGELIAAKYRKAPAKQFFTEAECEPCLFGWQALAGNERSIVICEGELDALAFAEYGIPALSVPFGGGKAGKQTPWIDSEFDRLRAFDWIHLALDADAVGRDATAEIVRRLGRERCKLVELPRKDANECLTEGVPAEAIRDAIANAKTLDPESLRDAAEFEDALLREFSESADGERGIRLPWRKVGDSLILRESEVSIWAGFNGHGKSQVMGMVTLGACHEGWRTCVASMEFKPVKWLKRLTRQATAQAHPTPGYISHVARWFHDKLWVFDVTGAAKVAVLLEVFAYAARRYGVKLFVIDNLAKCGFGEDDYNGQKSFVDALTDFAKEHNVHVALVCHMRKDKSEEQPPDKMGVKGSGAITDMADTFVAVWRNKPKENALRLKKALKPGETLDAALEKQLDKCDAMLLCGKQRNGESEPIIYLWFEQGSLQYLENSHAKPAPIVDYSARRAIEQ